VKSDEDIKAQVQVQTPIEESLQGLGGPMTRARTKKVEESLKCLWLILRPRPFTSLDLY